MWKNEKVIETHRVFGSFFQTFYVEDAVKEKS